jgi:hypothetical protein
MVLAGAAGAPANAAPVPTGDVPVGLAPAAPDLRPDQAIVTDAESAAGTKVGTEVATDVSVGYDRPSTEIRHPGAAYVKVHFTSLKLAPGDFVTVADPAGREVHTYHGDPTLAGAVAGDSSFTVHRTRGFAAMSVEGDTAVVTLHRAGGAVASAAADRLGYGAQIDRFWRGFSKLELAANLRGPESVCGVDARRDVECYRTSHPTEFARANAVARLLIGGGGLCTAWRVGRTNRVLTNNHCISTAAVTRASEVQFDFQCSTCDGNNPRPGVKVSGLDMLATRGMPLDYTLFSVNNFATIQQFGTLLLDVRPAVRGERIYIPGHGDGRPKRLSIFTEAQNGQVCTVNSPNSGSNITYSCDTSGGNSGSPVLAGSSHRVIALHHLGSCPANNAAARIDLINAEIGGMIDNT